MATHSSILDSNAFRLEDGAQLKPEIRQLIERRQKFMGSGYRLFYRHPLNIVKGEGQYLWDSEGHKYLDAYNNVVSVGHCNKAVVDAVSKQMSTLNTHTRYLHENIVNYSESLLEMLPEQIDKVMYMCTGSEANDVAVRMAQNFTGGQGIIITQEAYHGNTMLISSLSPSIGKENKVAPWARLVPTPDNYRFKGPDFTQWYCSEIQKAIDDMSANGIKFAGMLADSIFSSDGVWPNPVGFVKAVVDVVHKNGGIYIADEVQPGFARTGDAFWGFARHGVLPDLVTMGKPMANGIPCSAVAGRHLVMESFTEKYPYFNTFGGNPVSMAAAQATLNYMKETDLLDHVKKTGSEFLKELQMVAGRHRCAGEVRGAGFFIGFEIVQSKETKEPDTAKALDLLELMAENFVLTSVCGPMGNILKIRPPLVFAQNDIAHFCEVLDKCLSIVESQQ